MKKIISFLVSFLMLSTTAACADNKFDSNIPAEISSIEVSQLMYKQEELSFPADYSGVLGLYYCDGVRFIYQTTKKDIKVVRYDENMEELSFLKLVNGSEDVYEAYCCTKPDGSILLLLMFVDYPYEEITDYEDYFKNAEIRFEIRCYSAEGELIHSNMTDFNKHFTFGESYIDGLYDYGGNYIISFKDGLALLDSDGETTDIQENNDYFVFATDTEGNTVAAGLESYTYMDGSTLNVNDSNSVEYGKWKNRTGPVFSGTGDFKLYFLMNDGIYGLTFDDEFIQLLDFLDSNISPSGVYCAAYGGEGKFVTMGADQTYADGMFYNLLTIRPDDYVENKQTVILGCDTNDNNAPEIASMYNKQSDSYNVELKKYAELDDLKLDVLAGSPPDVFASRESSFMYRYANLGAFADLYEIMEERDGLKKDDILDSVLQAYEYKGGLYGLPIAFRIDAYIANSDVIGREYTNWNYDEFFSFAENLPAGMHLGSRNSSFAYRDHLFDILCANSVGSWIDYDNYTCNFDSEEFIHLLEFCKNVEINEPFDWDNTNDEQEKAEYLDAETSLLSKTSFIAEAHISMPDDLFYNAISKGLFLDDNFTYLTAPSDDRRGTISPINNMCYSVLNGSPDPDGGWDFMNYIFSAKFQLNYLQTAYLFTSNKESMEYTMNRFLEATADYQIAVDPLRPYADGDGTWEEGVDWIYKPIDDETLQYFNDFIAGCNKLRDADSSVYDIVKEEYEDCLNGEVTAQQCAEMIQNRVSLYLSEQS